jgi:hypothetical protein
VIRYLRSQHLASLALLANALSSATGFAQQGISIFEMQKGDAFVNASEIAKLSEPARVVIAFYAFQYGAGCEGFNSDGLQCDLTSALGFRYQCSPEHIQFIHKGFSGKVAILDNRFGDYGQQILSEESLHSRCYNTPNTATFQSNWNFIRITTTRDRMTVDSKRFWLARERSGYVSYRTVFALKLNTISLVSTKILKRKSSGHGVG